MTPTIFNHVQGVLCVIEDAALLLATVHRVLKRPSR